MSQSEFLNVCRNAKLKLEKLLDEKKNDFHDQYDLLIKTQVVPPLPEKEVMKTFQTEDFIKKCQELEQALLAKETEKVEQCLSDRSFFNSFRTASLHGLVDRKLIAFVMRHLQNSELGQAWKGGLQTQVGERLQKDPDFNEKSRFFFEKRVLEIELIVSDEQFSQNLRLCQEDPTAYPEVFEKDPYFEYQHSLLASKNYLLKITDKALEYLKDPAVKSVVQNIMKDPKNWEKYLENPDVKKKYIYLINQTLLPEPEIPAILSDVEFKKRLEEYRKHPEKLDEVFQKDPKGNESTLVKKLIELGAFIYYPKEIRDILEDPKMASVLKEIQTIPSALNRYMQQKDSPIAQNLEKLIQSGFIRAPIAEKTRKFLQLAAPLLKKCEEDPDLYYEILVDPTRYNEAELLYTLVQERLFYPPPVKQVREYIRKPEVMKFHEKYNEDPYKIVEGPEDSPEMEIYKQLLEYGVISPPLPKEVRDILSEEEWKKLIEEMKKDAEVYWKIVAEPESDRAKKLKVLVDSGIVEAPFSKQVQAILNDKDFNEKVLSKEPSLIQKILKEEPDSENGKKLKVLIDEKIISMEEIELRDWVTTQEFKDVMQKLNDDPQELEKVLQDPEIKRKWELLQKSGLLQGSQPTVQSLLESKEHKELIENDKELRQICENVFRDPLMTIFYLENKETAQKIKDLQDLEILTRLPVEMWKFEDGSLEEAKAQIPELKPIAEDTEYIQTLLKVCQDPNLSEKLLIPNKKYTENTETLCKYGLLTIFNPRDRNYKIVIDYKALARTHDCQVIMKNREVRNSIALCYQGPALLDDLLEEPNIGPALNTLIEHKVLLKVKRYPDYRWVFDDSIVPEELNSILKDKKFEEDLNKFLDCNGEDEERNWYEDKDFMEKVQPLLEIGALKEIPVYESWSLKKKNGAQSLKLQTVLGQKEFMRKMKEIEENPLLIYEYLKEDKFRENCQFLVDNGALEIQTERMIEVFTLYQPGPKQKQNPDIMKIYNDQQFMKQLNEVIQDPTVIDKYVENEEFSTKVQTLIDLDLIEIHFAPKPAEKKPPKPVPKAFARGNQKKGLKFKAPKDQTFSSTTFGDSKAEVDEN